MDTTKTIELGQDLTQAMAQALVMAGSNIIVNSDRYEELLQAEKTLNALYAGGVDNWEWYEEALSELD